jgi:TonB-linked SusC/RagA family outer membrane protein
VTIQGTLTGVVTDANGKYTIIVPNKDAVLVFSFVGYSTQELPVGDQAEINIILEENVREIDEVVVVGYGTIQRKYFTGSVSTVNVANSPIGLSSRSNTMDMLRGTTVGVVTSREAESGSNPSIQIHGQKSVNGSSAPLIVLDGVIYLGSMRDIDPFSVESISVLKDATSLAAYGSQAANGVVMITTKKGKLGKPVINLNGSLAISYKTMMPELLSPEDFVRKTNYSKGVTDGNPQSWMKPTLYENYLAGNTTDWLDYSTRTGLTQNYSLSVSGASEKFNYYLSLSHIDQKGIMIGDDYSRETLNARVQNDITNWLQVGVQFNYAYNNYDGVAGKIIPYLSPYGQPTRPNGELEKYVAEEGGNHINPLWDTYKGGTVDDYERFATAFLKGHVLLKAPWIEGLTYRLNLSYSEEVYKHDKFTHEGNYVTEGSSKDDTRYLPETLAGYLSSANGFNQRRINDYYLIDNILNYTTQLNKHYIDLTAVYTRDEFTSDNRRQSGNNFATIGNTLLSYDGLSFASTQTIETTETRKANIGYLGRINYNYDGKYHLSASIRRDGSSVFGTDSKWGIFPAVGAAWTVSRENFMERVPVINYLKLRTSWGKNGNQSLSPYGTLSTINLGQIGNHPYFFGNSDNPSWGQYVSTMGNSALGWEATTAINVGFELDLLNDRIHIEFDAYKSKTVDQIFDRTIPVMGNGFNKTKATMGQVDNQGYEFTLNTINIRRSNFEWSTMLNFYLNRNKLVDLYGDGKDDIASSRFLGKSLEAIYGYKNIGIVQEDDTEYIAANTTNPGFPKYANLDGSPDGKITAEDRTILGYKKENFRMNMSHTLTYKGWELYAMFTGVFSGGGYGLDVNEDAYLTQPDPIVNINHIWWTPENRSNVYPLPNRSWTDYTPVMSYAFVRLQDLNLSYTFRQQILKDWGINHLRAYISVKNLFTITDWVGGDPETRQSFGMGRALSGYPLQKTFLFGVNISF